MSARRQTDEPLVRPTTAFFLGFVSICLGLLIGIGDRARQPAESVREIPPEEDRIPGTLYYVPGSDRMSASPADFERRFLATESPLRLLEGDINAWTRQTLPFPARPAEDDQPNLSIMTGPPNFKFEDDFAQVVIPMQVRLLGSDYDVAFITTGDCGREGGGAAFRARTASFGSAPVPPFLVSVATAFAKRIYRDAERMPELERAWDEYSTIRTTDGAITLTSGDKGYTD